MPGHSQITADTHSGAAGSEPVSPLSAQLQLDRRRTMALLLVIAALTVLAYTPVLFNFFVGDDYVHLTWLKQAVLDPQLIWKNFHSSWLDGVTTKFYRPLISVFMVTDYLVWHTNGLGFHLTNLAFHLMATLGLFGVVKELYKGTDPDAAGISGPSTNGSDWWALSAAALFALYPLHPEAVAWITGRVDTIVTAFTVVSLWCYMRWRNQGAGRSSAGFAIGAGVCLILALLSKEMAVTLPAVFLCYEGARLLSRAGRKQQRLDEHTAALLAAGPLTSFEPDDDKVEETASEDSFARSAFNGVVCTLPFWAVVAGYFAVRRLALGTFVGGYDDSLFFIPDAKQFVLGWAHALRMVLIPVNAELLGSHNLLTRLWQTLIVMAALLSLYTGCRDRKASLRCAFLAAWFALALVPVYKIFAIADDLQGSRLAYMATAPLCAALMLMLSAPVRVTWARGAQRFFGPLKAAVAVAFVALAGVLLYMNNGPWAQAGVESNRIRTALEELYTQQIKGDPEVLLVGLPDTTAGAYTCRNALQGMTQTPQFSRDVLRVLQINPFEPIFPFGYLKESMSGSPQGLHIYRWDGQTGKFTAQPLPATQPREEMLLTVGPTPLKRQPGMRGKLYSVTAPDLPCWSIEFVRADVTTAKPEIIAADLFYTNSAGSQFELKRRSHAQDERPTTHHTLVFPLRGLPDWALGGQALGFRLGLPVKSDAQIEAVKVIPRQQIMPVLSFPGSGYAGSKGYLHLGSDVPTQSVTVDYSSLKGAAAATAEVTRANLLFEEQNSTSESKVQAMMLPFSASGALVLRREQFKTPGIYELRAWAKDPRGQPLGVCSDHIVIAVDP